MRAIAESENPYSHLFQLIVARGKFEPHSSQSVVACKFHLIFAPMLVEFLDQLLL